MMKNLTALGLVVAFFLSTACSAFAYGSVDDSRLFDPSLAMDFAVVTILFLIFALVSWLIKIIFFRNYGQLSVVFLGAFLFAVALAMFGTFVIPAFMEVLVSFGANLSCRTNFVFAYKNYLWSPALFVLAPWLFLKNSLDRDRYFAFVLFVEAGLLVFCLSALHSTGPSCG